MEDFKVGTSVIISDVRSWVTDYRAVHGNYLGDYYNRRGVIEKRLTDKIYLVEVLRTMSNGDTQKNIQLPYYIKSFRRAVPSLINKDR